jgi:hypothetical protein
VSSSPQLEEETDMGREQMRNLETFKVGANAVNEFEYQQNQGELTEQLEHHPDQQNQPAPVTQAERVEQIMADAHEKVEERKRRGTSSFGKKKPRAKKLAAKSRAKSASRKQAKKSTARKATGKKASIRKSASKKSAGKKAAKKSSAKKSAARKSSGKKSTKSAARRRS